MSWLKSSSLIAIVATLTLFAFTTEARAEHVDWSSYIDHGSPLPSSKTPKVASASDDAAPHAAKGKHSRAKKTIAAKSKSKRSKVKARSKKSRRK